MKPCLTYKNGPTQGVQKAFGPGAPLSLTEGQCEIVCTFEGNVTRMEVKAGRVLLGQGGQAGGQRVQGIVELRPGDMVILQELRLSYSLEPGEPPAPTTPPPAPKPEGLVISRAPKADARVSAAPAAGPAVVITSERKAAAPPAADTPKPARWLFGFLAPEKQKNAYYNFLLVIFLLLASFGVGAVWGSQTKIKELENTELEPSIRRMLYDRAKLLGWDYPKLLEELQKAEPNQARPLAVWWLTLPQSQSRRPRR